MIGVGNYCKVLLTHSIINPMQKVAIKVIDKIRIADEFNLDHNEILKQLRDLMALDHKGVVNYFEIYHDVSNIYLVMEYLDGISIN
jgi:serine/threonine protein kinase